jgi:hypothetical protein
VSEFKGIKWMLLPFEFKGMWLHAGYGDPFTTLSRRFDPTTLVGEAWVWYAREMFERFYGKVEAVLVDADEWDRLTIYITPHVLIYTKRYVVIIGDYDGYERFIAVPRYYKRLVRGSR